MARASCRPCSFITRTLLALLAAPGVYAQLTNVPNLATATNQPSSSQSTSVSSTITTGAATTAFAGLTDVPSIPGAGIPQIKVPVTANAPYMQKSNLPEGTIFIIVGAILAFLGVSVLAWRVLIVWSINRSVKRAALASIHGSEKASTWGGSSTNTKPGYYPSKSGYYSEYAVGSSMSLDALNSAGKQLHKPHYRDSDSHARRSSAVPPSGLFFSPTAQPANRGSFADTMNRNSSFLPAGYYASPSAAQPAAGAPSTVVGGSLAPYARQSRATPSPPGTSNGPTTRSTASYHRDSSRDTRRPHEGRRTSSRDGARSSTRQSSYGTTGMYNHSSSSSLMVSGGAQHGGDGLGGTRAPSAYLDDLFSNHGNGPRERS